MYKVCTTDEFIIFYEYVTRCTVQLVKVDNVVVYQVIPESSDYLLYVFIAVMDGIDHFAVKMK